MGVSTLVVFDDLDVEALAVIANEAAEEVESSARKTVEHAERCGRALLAAKEKIPHGQWLGWLGTNFDYSQVTASQYMRIANYKHASSLASATSIREALKLIADDPETPKRERKPGVEVVEPIEAQATPGKQQLSAPEKTSGETATNAVNREETRKAPAHRPPEKFAEVTQSYADEEPEAVPMRLESGFDEVEATERIRSLIHKEMARWPNDRQAEAIQVFHLYLGDFGNE
jgi:hypothetical protein